MALTRVAERFAEATRSSLRSRRVTNSALPEGGSAAVAELAEGGIGDDRAELELPIGGT